MKKMVTFIAALLLVFACTTAAFAAPAERLTTDELNAALSDGSLTKMYAKVYGAMTYELKDGEHVRTGRRLPPGVVVYVEAYDPDSHYTDAYLYVKVYDDYGNARYVLDQSVIALTVQLSASVPYGG